MIKKHYLLIILNILFFICYKIVYRTSNIKQNYEKWNQFYEDYKSPPFKYIENYLPFSVGYLFSKIWSFNQKLSYFIFNTEYSPDDFEENDSQIQLFNINETNKSNFLLSESDLKYNDFFSHAIDEINTLDAAVDNGIKINIAKIMKNGFNKNKIIVLFIFFVQQLNIFQNLKQNFDLNKIYLFGKNKTNIEKLEIAYEALFNYEDIQEIISLSNQFIDYHKDFGFFILKELKEEKIPSISKSEKQLINIVINLNNKNSEEYKYLNDFELSLFLDILEKTSRSINYLGMTESSYKKGLTYYKTNSIILLIGFIVLNIFINIIIITHYEEGDKNKLKRKTYKLN